MSVIRWFSLFLFLAIMAAFFQGYRSWELLVAALMLGALVFWTCGAFAREVWFGSPKQDAECARIDAELDAFDRRHP